METKKDHMIMLQLVVGVLFIVISGAIFISNAWERIPLLVKQGMILAGGIGCFAGYANMERVQKFPKVRIAMYYLGSCFGGLFLLSMYAYIEHAKELAFCAGLVVLFLVTFRFGRTKEVFDYVMAAIMTDVTAVLGMIAFTEDDWNAYNLIFALLVLVFGVLDYHYVSAQRDRSIRIANLVFYILHIIEFVWQVLANQFLYWLDETEYKVAYFGNLAVACILAFLLYRSRGKAGKMVSWTVTQYIGWQLVHTICESDLLEEFALEIHAIVFALGIVLLGRIWYDKKREIRWVQLLFTVGLFSVLLLYNLTEGGLLHALLVCIAAVGMLGVAVVTENRGYGILAVVVLVLMVFHVTWEFWRNIEWWVYLFAAGVALIALAIRKERK